MRVAFTHERYTALFIAIAVVGSLCLFSTAAFAQASKTPMAFASNVGSTAYIYTDNITTSTPTSVTGNIQISAMDVTPSDTTTSDKATVMATFTYPANGSTYTVRLTGVDPAALGCPSQCKGVAFMQPMFGTSGIGPADFPQILAYVALFGRATIMKDGESIATDQPIIALVTQGLHDTSQRWLSTSDPTNQEIHLVVPGSLMGGGQAVTGFPRGGFYVYWPDAALDLRNIGGAVNMSGMAGAPPPMPTTTPTPAMPARGPTTTISTMAISLTNTGIRKTIGEAPFGLYAVKITNDSSRSRGLYFTGIDLCCTEYNRFSNILRPGQSQTFRFYFAPGKVVFRDFLSADKTRRAYTDVQWGGHSSSIVFK